MIKHIWWLLCCVFINNYWVILPKTSQASSDTTWVYNFLKSDSAFRMHPSLVSDKIAGHLHDTATAREIIIKIDNEGYRLRNLGIYQKSLFYHHLALSLAYRFNFVNLQARIYNNLGVLYRRMDDYEPALQYHLQALRLAELIGSKRSIAIALNSIGNINYMMGKYDVALKYFLRGYAMEKQDLQMRGMAINLNNIGNVYKSKGDTLLALRFYNQSLKLNEKIKDVKGIGICLNDIGMIYQSQGKISQALDYFLKAYQYFQQTNDIRFIAEVSRNIGKALQAKNRNAEAVEYLLNSYNIAKQIEAKWEEEASARALSQYCHEVGEDKKAYQFAQIAHQLRDKIDREHAQKNISNAQAVFKLEKTEKEKEFYQNLSHLTALKLKREKQIRIIFFLIILLGLLAMGLILFFRRRYTRRLRDKNEQLEEARDELKKYAQKLELALEKAEASVRAKNVFLANISHEFRTPLNAIVGFSSLLRSRSHEKETIEMLEIIIHSAYNLIDLITDLLNISAIEVGQLEIKEKPVDIKLLLKETENVFKLEAQQKAIGFTLDISPSVPDFILSDEGKLRQVLFNLVGNAVKFTKSGKVEIKAWCEVSKEGTNKDLLICIKDTGPGIAPEEQSRIFEPFYQGNIHENDLNGKGLGLSIVKKILDKMGGKITVNSALGKGSEFIISFCNVQEAKVLKSSLEENYHEHNEMTRKLQALVVDDLEINRMLIAKFLEDSDIEPIFASSGREAIQKAQSHRPAFAFIDIRMPGMDGFECAQKIRQLPENKGIKLIAVTASVLGKDMDALSNPPFDAFILKPIEYNSFQRMIKNLTA